MTGKDKHMPLYSSSDIEKYLSGELPDPEMHAMERAALDDPFLADALEGMVIHRSLPEQPSFQQEIASLQKRLDDRVSLKKRRVLPLAMKYAAAVILLLGVGITAWYTFFSRNMASKSLAKHQVEVPREQSPARQDRAAQATTPAAATPDSTGLTLADGKAVALSETEGAFKKVSGSTSGSVSRERKADSLVHLKKDLTASYSFSPSATADKEMAAPTYRNNFSDLSKQPAAPSANNAASNLARGLNSNSQATFLSDSLIFRPDSLKKTWKAKTFDGASDQLVFKGKVLNTQNLPLAGATLSYKTGRAFFNTVTDANGYFSLQLPKYDTTSRMVAVNYAGYEQGYVKLNTDDKSGNVILLRPQSASLNEVVVVGFGAKRKELTRTDINSVPLPLSETAVPADGWPAYTNYLESNKNSSQIDTTIRGYESISFIVSNKGELSHFKVERSLSPAHDSLAIRLVKEGPSWKLLKGKKEKARVILTW